jgi:hypothetical protein
MAVSKRQRVCVHLNKICIYLKKTFWVGSKFKKSQMNLKSGARAMFRPLIEYTGCGNRQVLEADANWYSSIVDFLANQDLRITQDWTSLECDLDIDSAVLPSVLRAAGRISARTGERAFISNSRGDWMDVARVASERSCLKLGRQGFLELAVVGADNRLKHRFTINLWHQRAGFNEALAPSAPIKRVKFKMLPCTRSDQKIEPIDVVYTWVNGSDPKWLEMVSKYCDPAAVDRDRFGQSDELRYSLRSVQMYAPWVRAIYILSNCSPPSWFAGSENIKWIRHEDIIPESYLPLFNSHAIETFIHNLPGLSEQFLYFNDDFFLGGFVRPTDFFTAYGQSVARLEPHGIVQHFREERDSGRAEAWQCAAANGADILKNEAGILPTKIHRHAPYAIYRTTFEELLKTFANEVHMTRSARFRRCTDISFASFLYHHFALTRRRATESNENAMVVRPTNYRRFCSQRLHKSVRFFCINDGGGSSEDSDYARFKETFLSFYYPFKSTAEI